MAQALENVVHSVEEERLYLAACLAMPVTELEEEGEEAAQQYCPSLAAEAVEFLMTWSN